jgi:hypothetical protein
MRAFRSVVFRGLVWISRRSCTRGQVSRRFERDRVSTEHHPLIVSFSLKVFRRVRLRVKQVFDSNPRCARVVWPNFDHGIRSRLFGLLQPVLILFQLEEILLEPEQFTIVAGVLFRTLHVYPKGNAGLPGLTVAITGHGVRERLNIISDLRQNAARSRSYRASVNHDR